MNQKSEVTHDRLQSQCFLWAWNTYPQIRPLLFMVPNEQGLLSYFPTAFKMQYISQLRSLGLVKGVWDLLFYWKGILYAFDVKVGKDRLSNEQKAFRDAVVKNGGKCEEIGDFQQFQLIFKQILSDDSTGKGFL